MNDKTLRILIKAQDQASKTIAGVGDNIDNASKKGSEALGKLSSVAKGAAIAVGVALSAAVTAAAKASWDQVSAVEQATVGLKAYERNGDKVNSVLSNLIKYARSDLGVLFNRKDLFESAQSLKIMGDNTDDLVGHVQILSRSVGLGLSNWQDLNQIVGRVGSTGRLTGDDFDNLTKAGYRLDPALRNTNISFSELFKSLDKGIPADALEGQANTIKGAGIRLQTAFRGIGDAILGVDSDTSKFTKGSLGEALVNGLSNTTQLLKNLKPVISDIMASFTQLGIVISQTIGRFAEFVRPGFEWFLTNIYPSLVVAVNVIGQILTTAWNNITAAMKEVDNAFKSTGLNIDWVKLAMQAFGVILVATLVPISALIVVVSSLIAGIATLIGWVVRVEGAIYSFTIRAAGAVYSWTHDMVQSIADVIGSFSNFFSYIGNLGSRIVGAFAGAGSWLYNAGRSIIDGLINGIQDSIGRIGATISNIGTNIANSVKGKLHDLKVPGFATGGFTGRGGANQVAGVVHKGEYVVPKDQVDQTTGLPKGGSGSVVFNQYGSINLGSGEAVNTYFDRINAQFNTQKELADYGSGI